MLVPAHVCRRVFFLPGETQLCLGISLLCFVFVLTWSMKTLNMTLAGTKEQRQLAQNSKVLGKFFNFSCGFLTFRHSVYFTSTQLLERHSHSLFILFYFFFATFDSFVWISPDKWMETVCKYFKRMTSPLFWGEHEKGGQARKTRHIVTLIPDLRHQLITHDPEHDPCDTRLDFPTLSSMSQCVTMLSDCKCKIWVCVVKCDQQS